MSRVANTYAKALLDLAIENKDLTRVQKDVDILEKSLASRDLVLLLKSPIINKDMKRKAIKAVFGKKLGKVSTSFIDIIIRKGRENLLPEIIKSFDGQYKKYKQITTVVITTATKMTEANLKEIKAKLLKSNITDKSLEMITKVDPSVIGGFVIEIGDKLYDASVAHQFNKLRKEFSVNDFVKAF